jgi:hypothetical protein
MNFLSAAIQMERLKTDWTESEVFGPVLYVQEQNEASILGCSLVRVSKETLVDQ